MIIDLYLDVCRRAVAAVEAEAVRRRWDEPSALAEYTVGGLAGHTLRSVLNVERYLGAGDPDPGAEVTDASGYMTTVLGQEDPVDSDLHRTIRERAAKDAGHGPDVLLDRARAAVQHLEEELRRPGAGDRRLAVLDGITMTVAEYARTRLVELVVHLDDLAVSVGEDGPDLPEGAYRLVAGVLGEIAARRAGGLTAVRSLSRAERQPDCVRAL